MARYILKGDKRAFPDKPRPSSKDNIHQAVYVEIPTLPPGGTTNQVLSKTSNVDYDVYWMTTITGANNGLSMAGDIVQLGGILIKNTTIDGASFNLVIPNLGTFTIEADAFNILANTSFNLRTPNVINSLSTSGQYLRLNNAASGASDWADLENYNIVLNQVSPYTVSTNREVVLADSTLGIYTVNHKATPTSGDIVIVKKIDNSINTVTITPGVGHTIDGGVGETLTLFNQSITMIFDGVSNWVVVSKYL